MKTKIRNDPGAGLADFSMNKSQGRGSISDTPCLVSIHKNDRSKNSSLHRTVEQS